MPPSGALLLSLSLAATAAGMRLAEERYEGKPSRGDFSPSCKPYPGRRVVMVTVNMEFVDFFMNWFYYAKRHLKNTEHLAIFPQDKQIVPVLREFLPRTGVHFSLFDPPPGNFSFAAGPVINIWSPQNSSEDNVETLYKWPWGTEPYIKIVWRRPHYLLQLLQQGCTVLYADVDAVWQKDPFLDIGQLPGYSMHVVSDTRDEKRCFAYVCSCFMYLQPVPEVKDLLRRWSSFETSKIADKGNQPALSYLLGRTPLKNFTCLPKSKFPTGKDTDLFPSRTIAHANWMVGYDAKKCFLAQHELWVKMENATKDCSYQFAIDEYLTKKNHH